MENEDLAIRSHAIAITILFSYSKRGWSRGGGIMGGPMLFNVGVGEALFGGVAKRSVGCTTH
ncbi:hypothetical protein NC653_032135 [Populus alba x Populus x berolinensis]|uniref:Uncharacterized protein n=1 Tax=Populus alba x Populus x berolinensis TaxID=444605 RepID=A0AAD6PXM2_9ROSI|nr:hypothetical protein NC653_032135 [Populus alba x Populus x berolinensis]